MRKIIIECENGKEKGDILNAIHMQLKGNRDYIDSNIVLSDNNDWLDQYTITVYIKDGVKEMPKIII